MSKLPHFPDFEIVDLKHQDIINAIVHKFDCYSDYNFVSMFGWDVKGEMAVAELHDNLVVRFTDYITGDAFLSFIGTNKTEETIDELVDYSSKNGLTTTMSLVPEYVVNGLPQTVHERYTISEDRDSHDYLLSVEQLSKFESKRFATKRNLFNRFVRTHGDKVKNHELDLTSPQTLEQIETLMQEWKTSRGRTDDDTLAEFTALRRDLKHAKQLGIRSYGTFIDDKLVAFNIFEITHDRMAMVHFDKANVAYEGVFEHLKQNFAKHLMTLDITTINYQQDVGIPGLRTAKSSWQPIGFLKKYTITPKS